MRLIGLVCASLLIGLSGCGGDEQGPAATATTTGSAASPAASSDIGADGSTPSAAEVQAAIEQQGATAAVAALNQGPDGEPNAFSGVLDQVAAGDEAYLALVPQLSEGVAPATATEDDRSLILSALQRGLAANPAGVLRRTSASLPVADVCAPGGGAGAEEPTETYNARALAAVEAVTDAAVMQQRDACLTALKAGGA